MLQGCYHSGESKAQWWRKELIHVVVVVIVLELVIHKVI
ncbi:hypothetical protein KSS87_023631, partial [Heliosperma pusillum]